MRTTLSHKQRLAFARKDLQLKLAYENQLENNIGEPLERLYKFVCDNRLNTIDCCRANPSFGRVRDSIVKCLEQHYKSVWRGFKAFNNKNFQERLQTKGITINDGYISPQLERLLRVRAEQQADLIIQNSLDIAKSRRAEIVATLLQTYIDDYIDEQDERVQERAGNETLLLLLAAIGTRAALIAQVETGYAGETAKLIGTLEVRDALLAEAAGEISEGQLGTDIRTALHTSESLEDFLDAIDDFDLIEDRDFKKEWNAIMDSKTRETHAEADGQVQPLMSPFEVGDSLLMFPGDTSFDADFSEIANCRCAAMYY